MRLMPIYLHETIIKDSLGARPSATSRLVILEFDDCQTLLKPLHIDFGNIAKLGEVVTNDLLLIFIFGDVFNDNRGVCFVIAGSDMRKL